MSAEALLRANDRGSHNLPSPHLYPHQWNWDSAFSAIGWSHLDPERGLRELERLLGAQWDDGRVPHIRFAPDGDYAPGPEFWGTGERAVPSSSITQPPVAASAARRLFSVGADPARVAALIPRLERWHDWLLGVRGFEGGVCVTHPWESGMDNAPRWDAALDRWTPSEAGFTRVDTQRADPATRPSDEEYRRYAHLVAMIRERDFDEARMVADSPLLVADVAMTAILHAADEDLLWLGARLGVDTGAEERLLRMAGAFRALFWTDEGFRDFDVRAQEPVSQAGAWELVPLFCGGITSEQARRVRARLDEVYAAEWPIPTVPVTDAAYREHLYWRGPTWINVNWLVVRGLERHGFESAELRSRTLQLVERSGFREHYSALTGEGSGARDFTWSAALALDLRRS